MEVIRDAPSMTRALRTTLNPWLKRLLTLRRDQLGEDGIEIGGLGPVVIVEPSDTLDAIEQAIGVPIATNLVDGIAWPDPDYVPSWEWCQSDHGWYEIVYVLTDAGDGVVLLVPDRDGIDPILLAIIRTFADRDDGNHA